MYYNRTSPRRSNYDYTSAGGYFITICTARRQHYFWEIIDWEMKLNDLWKHCYHCWNEIPNHYPFVDIDEFVVMPNHIHWILMIGTHDGNRDGERRDISYTSYSGRRDVSHTSSANNTHTSSMKSHTSSTNDENTKDANGENMEDAKYCVPTTTGIQHQSWSLWSIVRGFKIGITKYATSWIQIPYWDTFARQPRYHDRIIRNEDEYNKIKYYIQTNPQNRQKDKLYQT